MASLSVVQQRIPTAEVVGGKVQAFHEGKHWHLGDYVGDGAVVLSKDGERFMAPPEDTPVEKKTLGLPKDAKK